MRPASLAVLLLFAVPAAAAEFHVAPGGAASGDGTESAPWDLATALAHPAAVAPGDTILLGGGVYAGAFVATLAGTESAPITVRSRPGEWARIDLPAVSATDALSLQGAYTVYRDFEVFSSDRTHPRDLTSVAIGGEGLLLADLVIHDVGNNMFHGVGGEVYGCLLYNNGTDGAFLAHHLYTQNDDPARPARITDSLIFNGYAFGVHAYATHGWLDGIIVEGNVWWGNGAAQSDGDRKDNCIVGGVDHAPSGIVLRDNLGWAAAPGDRSVALGRYNDGNVDLTLEDNYLVGATDFTNPWQALAATGNTFIGPTTGSFDPLAYPDNTYLAAAPTETVVFVRPSRVEPGRAHVVVYNWAMDDSVAVDLSTVLSPGDAWEARNGQNYLAAPVASGTFDGAAVLLPMSAGDDPALPIGPGRIDPEERTGRAFNVFVVQLAAAAPPPLPDGGPGATGDGAGCGCRAGGSPGAAWPLLLLLLAACRRRRRGA